MRSVENENNPHQISRAVLFALLIGSFACFISICLWLSAHRMMWADEFDAWHLIADPSWRHAFESLNKGADGGPPLFYAIGRLLTAVAGLHPVVVRLYSAFCFWLAAVIWAQILRRHFNTLLAVSAVVLAFLCNFDVVDQMAQVRFYGQLVLATSLAVHILLALQRRQPAPVKCLLWSALAGLLLVASHPLGLVYSSVILCAQMLTNTPVRKRLASAAGTLLSWTYLALVFLPLKGAASTDTWLAMPNAAGVLHFYDNHPVLLVKFRYVGVALNIILLALAVYACAWFFRRRKWHSTTPSDSLPLLFFISIGLALMPIAFYILSHLYKPLFLGRYLLPSGLGIITLSTAGAWLLIQRLQVRLPKQLPLLVGIPLALIAFLTISSEALYPPRIIEPILQLAQSTPVVLENGNEVPEAHYYAPSRSANLFLVVPRLKPGQVTTLHSTMLQGYAPEIIFDEAFLQQHREFLYVDSAPASQVFDGLLDSHWSSSYAGTVNVWGDNLPVIRYTRTD